MTKSGTSQRAERLPTGLPRIALALIFCGGLLGLSTAANAQTQRWSLEGRGGLTFPTGDFSNRAGAGSGFAVGLDVIYNVATPLSVYAGGSRDEFDGNFSSTGLQSGLKFMPLQSDRVLPWVSGGVLVQRFNTQGAESGFEPGFEAGLGADFEVTPMFTLTPGVRYRRYDAAIGAGEISPRYFAATIAAHLHVR